MPFAESVGDKSPKELEDLAENATSRSVRRRARTQLSHPRTDKDEKKSSKSDA